MTDEQITAALQEVGAAWLMDPEDEACQANAMRHLAATVEQHCRDAMASKLIDVWIANHGQRISWKRAVNIIAILKGLPDAERDRLLALDQET